MRAPGLAKVNTLAVVLAFMVVMLPTSDADAAGFRIDTIPSLRLEEGFHTNVYDSDDGEVASLATRLSPGLAIRLTAPDEVKLQLSGSYERTWYHDSDARDADDSTWNLRVESSGAWKFTPSFAVRPSAYYLRTPDSYRRVQLLPSDDPNVPPVSITNYGTAETDEFGGGLGFEYTPSPNWAIGINGNYSRQRFPGDNNAGFGLTDASQYGGGFTVTYAVTPRSKLGVTGSATHHEYEDNESTNSYYAGIQFGYQFTPVLRFDGNVGGSQIRLEDSGGGEERKDTSPSGSFGLSYVTPDSVARFFGSAVYTGSSGYGEATRQWTVGLAFTNRLTIEWSWTFNGAYQKSESVFTEESVDIDSIYGRAGLQYRPLEWVMVDGYISLDRQESDGLFGHTINSYSAVLGLTIGKAVNIY
ncbi:MAG: MtrB/PioB family outer membrane beta-barrel protein [Deltaproteobacteria bacterium]|nr:MtrB/PioB family outer membrane beta-barrel protein [Deltaproteobacteria bacterium]